MLHNLIKPSASSFPFWQDAGIDLDKWVQELDVYNMDAPDMPTDDPELKMIHLYEIKNPGKTE